MRLQMLASNVECSFQISRKQRKRIFDLSSNFSLEKDDLQSRQRCLRYDWGDDAYSVYSWHWENCAVLLRAVFWRIQIAYKLYSTSLHDKFLRETKQPGKLPPNYSFWAHQVNSKQQSKYNRIVTRYRGHGWFALHWWFPTESVKREVWCLV